MTLTFFILLFWCLLPLFVGLCGFALSAWRNKTLGAMRLPLTVELPKSPSDHCKASAKGNAGSNPAALNPFAAGGRPEKSKPACEAITDPKSNSSPRLRVVAGGMRNLTYPARSIVSLLFPKNPFSSERKTA